MASKTEENKMTMTKKELATVAGYTYRQLYNIDRDLPDDKKLFVETEDGKYDLSMFVQRWVDYNLNRTNDITSLDDAKTAHEIVKTRKTELEVARLEGLLVDVNEVHRKWTDVANTVMQNMLRLPSKIAPQIANMASIQVIQAIIDKEIREVLISIAETPLPEEASVKETAGQEDE